MKDTLPDFPRLDESGIVNLDNNDSTGTHWVAYTSKDKIKIYFDSFGLDPPEEIIKYLGRPILIQTFQLQRPEDVICGHLCIHVLKELSMASRKGTARPNLISHFKNIILELI